MRRLVAVSAGALAAIGVTAVAGSFTSSGGGGVTTSGISTDAVTASSTGSLTLKGNVANGAAATGVVIDNTNNLTNATSRVLVVKQAGGESISVEQAKVVVGIELRTGAAIGGNGVGYLWLTSGNVANSGNAIVMDSDTLMTTGKLVSGRNQTTEKWWVGADGRGGFGGVDIGDPGTRPTCDSSARGLHWFEEGGTGVADVSSKCVKGADDNYSWADY